MKLEALLLYVCLKFLTVTVFCQNVMNHEWSWNATVRMKMPSDETTYWCSLHKGPDLFKKHHVISLNALLPDENAMKFTHHFSINMCILPKDGSLDEAFEDNSINNGVLGSDCFKTYHNPGLSKLFPLCRQLLYAWAKGGQKMVFPESAGYPIGDNDEGVSSGRRYFKLQIHYNNPQKLENITFETGVQLHYTDLLRENDMGMMLIGHGITKAMVVPPNTSQFIIAGHCSPECTNKFPQGGLTVSNVFLHAHLSGRKIKLRHFRAGKELPWIDSNDHYDFNHQESTQIPLSASSGKILPGDHLICECEYDTTWKKGSVVLGGEGTRDEMCEAFVWYYPKVNVVECTSSYPMRDNLKDFGITSVFLVRKSKELLILEPTSLQGDYEESLNTKIDWNESFVRGLERRRRFGMHETACVSTTRFEILRQKGKIIYPKNSTNVFSGNACCM